MKNLQKGFAVPIIIAIVVLLIIGGFYYTSKKNNWGCALDSQGIQIYVKALDLEPYLEFKDKRDSQILNDVKVITELKNKNIVYAEDSNDCYGKHIYKIKNTDNELVVVNLDSFSNYLANNMGKNLCGGDAVKIRQSGNSPFFVDYRVCPGV